MMKTILLLAIVQCSLAMQQNGVHGHALPSDGRLNCASSLIQYLELPVNIAENIHRNKIIYGDVIIPNLSLKGALSRVFPICFLCPHS